MLNITFIKIPGVESKCAEKGYEKQLEINMEELDLEPNSPVGSIGNDYPVGGMNVSFLRFTKRRDGNTAQLKQRKISRTLLDEVTVTKVTPVNGKNIVTFSCTFKKCWITQHAVSDVQEMVEMMFVQANGQESPPDDAGKSQGKNPIYFNGAQRLASAG